MAKHGCDNEEHRHGEAHASFENGVERSKNELRDAGCRSKFDHRYRSGRPKVEQTGNCAGVAFPRRVVTPGRLLEAFKLT